MKINRAVTYCSLLCAMICALSVFCGCKPISYPFLHDTAAITDIKIVAIKGSTVYSSDDFEYDILAEIEDRDSFIERFKQIKFHRFLIGDPTHLGGEDKAILFFYENGDYEYVGYIAQAIVKNGGYYFGKVNCKKEQFEEFIQEWIE